MPHGDDIPREPLAVAVEAGDADEVERLLARGANPNVILIRESDGWSTDEMPVLVVAARAGSVRMVRSLAAAGAHLHRKWEYRYYHWPDGFDAPEPVSDALGEAARHGHIDVLQALLELGAKSLAEALERAATGGHRAAATLLLDHGADPGVGTNKPLLAAVGGDKLEMVRLLVERGALMDRPQKDDVHGPPICAAFALGRTAIARFMIDRGARSPPRAWVEKLGEPHKTNALKVLVELGSDPKVERPGKPAKRPRKRR